MKRGKASEKQSAPAGLEAALAAAVAAFHARTPPRIWSLIVSFIGDAIARRTGPENPPLQAGVIADFCALAGIEPGLVRTALSRLVAKGILARQREGRKSFYSLTAPERIAFEAAAALIYGRALPAPDGRWDVLLIDAAPDRSAARATALGAGYVALGPATLLRPHHRGRAACAVPGAVALTGEAAGLAAADWWPLDDLAASYRRFIARYAAFAPPLPAAAALAPADAALARVLLVHDFRRIILRDPFLPAAALPAHWPAAEARALFDAAHGALTPAADRWLDER